MPVRGAVHFMTGAASFDDGCAVFINVRSALIGMTL